MFFNANAQSNSAHGNTDLKSKENINVLERQLSSTGSSSSSSNGSDHGSSSHAGSSLTLTTPMRVHKSRPKVKPTTCGQPSLTGKPKPYDGAETHVLKETTSVVFVQCRKEFSSHADDILTKTPTYHAFIDYIATERLRSMPHQGSKWDKILKWAESYARAIDLYSQAIDGFTSYSWESARLVWGTCKLLLQMGPNYTFMLEKVFGVLYQVGQTLLFFLRNKRLFSSSAEIQSILAYAYSDIVRLTVEVTIHYKKSKTITIGDFDRTFGRIVDSFFYRKECFTSEAWACILRETTVSSTSNISIRTIRQWLATQDRTIEIFLSDRMGTRTSRVEYTCEWFEKHLKEFQRSNSDVFWVMGQEGSGKSVLMGWILERMKRTQGLRSGYDVISFTIDANLKSHRSSISVVKGLLLQLLERNVGDLSVYKILAALYERTERKGLIENQETAMWKAFDSALAHTTGKMMIIIDGLDHLDGGEPAIWELTDRLRAFASKYIGIKCLFLSRPMSKPCSSDIRQYIIDSSVNTRDVYRFVEVIISKEFRSLKEEERRTIIESITKISSGSFIWAQFSLQLIKTEKTVAGILKCLETLPKDLPTLLQRLCLKLDLKQVDTKLLISLLLAAERPLTVLELKCLFEIEISKSGCNRSARLTNIEEDIRNACGSLIAIRDGLVCFSHASIKEHILDLCLSDDEFKLSIEEAHTELTIRSLAYLKLCLKEYSHDLSFSCEWDDEDDLVQTHHFLDYAIRNYVLHFKRSSMYSSKGSHNCSAEFRLCFPDSSLLALIEGSWWEKQTSAHDALEMHLLALQLRKLSLGEKNTAVIQGYINVATTRKHLSYYEVASESYFEAWKIIKTVLGESHSVTRECAKHIISCTEKVTKRTEIITTRIETVYKYMYTHSETREETIRYAKILAELYIQLKKTEEALTVYKEVRKISIEVYGELHEETVKLTEKLSEVLEILNRHEESVTITRAILEITEKTCEVWETKRISATIRMVEVYEHKHQLEEAEKLLVKLRHGIIEACKSRREEYVHEAKIKITLQYVRFLKRHSRDKEAEKILIELWGEFRGLLNDKDNHGDRLLIQIRILGEELKKWKVMSVAESIFSALWGFYKRTGRTTTSEASTIAILLSSVLRIKKEIHSEETILREIFTATISQTTIDVTLIKSCIELSSFYERQERWSEAINICVKSLTRIWSSLIGFMESSSNGVCGLPERFHDESINIARRLAVCYFREGRIQQSESVYIYIFSACRSSLQIYDETIMNVAEYLVRFYESVGRIDKAIDVYHELYEDYCEVLGVSHRLTITITYKLANFCKIHQPRRAEQYYISIITALGHDSEECDSESVEAILAICRIYEQDKKYKEALKLYRKLWLTFCRHGRDCGMSTETIFDVYHQYVHSLERESQTSIVYEVTVQFRETCIKYYGKHHLITIQATIELARILEKEESGYAQAISIYEEVRKIISEHSELRIVLQTTFIEVRKRLAYLYSVNSSSTSKAEVIYFESWEEYKHKHGCSHDETLSRLYDLIMFFKKQNTKECIHTATVTLQTTIIEIITKEKDTHRLYSSAEAIAKLYLALGLKDHAFELLKEIRLQLISTETKTSTKFGFSLRKGHTIDRRAFVFVYAFEETLKGVSSATLYTEIMTDLMTETTLYESWMRTLQYHGGFESSLSIGARLRLFLLSKHREDECNKITNELWELFLAEVGEKTEKTGILWELFLVCVTEMGTEEHEVSVIEAGATAVVSHYEKGDFEGSFKLADWIYKYVRKHGGFVEQRNITVGFTLAICMAGRSTVAWKKCQDANLNNRMMALSKVILIEVLKASETEKMSFASMRLEELDQICAMLGDQGNFKDLERILRSLWSARLTRISWNADTVVSIGHRLVSVLFIRDHKSEAIELCEVILYNLRRIWGAFDPSTLDTANLLSSLYTSTGAHGKSMALHLDLLRETLADENSEELVSDVCEIIAAQMKLLKRSYQRLGRWDGDEKIYLDLWEEFEMLFGRDHRLWGMIREGHIKTWNPKGGVKDDIGAWKKPAAWGFLPTDGEKRTSRHLCHVREIEEEDEEEEDYEETGFIEPELGPMDGGWGKAQKFVEEPLGVRGPMPICG